MLSASQKFRLGLFVFISTAMLVALFLLFFSARFFKDYDYYFIRYKDISVNGLEVGGQVKYHGLRIGTISDMRIDEKDVGSVIVKIAVAQGDSIKTDVRAVITPMGITGLMMIELRGGTNEAPFIQPGTFINTGSSVTAQITGKAEEIAAKLELVLNNLIDITDVDNQQNLKQILASGAATLQETDALLKRNQDVLHASLANFDKAVTETRQLIASLNKTSSEIENIASSRSFKRTFTNLADVTESMRSINWDSVLVSLQNSTRLLENILQQTDQSIFSTRYDALSSVAELKEAIEQISEFSKKINRNPGLLLSGANRNDAKSDLPEIDP
jgi:phospholipid/cholesterol/gamma-HCH transport system substrate-binding protein